MIIIFNSNFISKLPLIIQYYLQKVVYNNNNNKIITSFINIFQTNCYLQVNSGKRTVKNLTYNLFRLKKRLLKA